MHTEDSEMREPRDVSRYPIDPQHAQKKSRWYISHEGGPCFVRAVETTVTVGDVSRTTRYEFEGGRPVEVWVDGEDIHVILVEDVLANRFPWNEPYSRSV